MIPGPYEICLVTIVDDDSDTATYRSVLFGYDSAEEAFNEIAKVAQENKLDPKDLVVIRFIDRDEAAKFTD